MKLARQEVLEKRAQYWDQMFDKYPVNHAATKDKVNGFQEYWDIVEPILRLTQKICGDDKFSLTDAEWGSCLICGIGTDYNTHADDCDLVVLRIYLRSLKFAGEERNE